MFKSGNGQFVKYGSNYSAYNINEIEKKYNTFFIKIDVKTFKQKYKIIEKI